MCSFVVVMPRRNHECVWCLQALTHVPPLQRERVGQLLLAAGYLRSILDIFRVGGRLNSSLWVGGGERVALLGGMGVPGAYAKGF